MTSTDSLWKPPWQLRWRGWSKWYRVAIGPLCVSVYPYRRRRPFISHSWRYRHADGLHRHAETFRGWLKVR